MTGLSAGAQVFKAERRPGARAVKWGFGIPMGNLRDLDPATTTVVFFGLR